MFEYVKNLFLKRYLAGNKPDRQKCITSLSRAKNVALLCEITDEDSYKDIFRIFARLQEEGHNVKLVGYVNEKEVPFYCLPQLSAEYFSKKNLNWYGKPNVEPIEDVINMEYDMLIDFNYRQHAAIQSMLALTHAKFVVGREKAYQNYYDLFIDAAKLPNAKYIEHVGVYTQKLMGYDK